ncbi:hypothetical protein M3J09_004506 [Ascochyta lentis]
MHLTTILATVFSLATIAVAAPQVAPTCGNNGDCASFCKGGPCTIPYCSPSEFGDLRCLCAC